MTSEPPNEPLIEWAFDLKLDVALRIKATTFEKAAEELTEKIQAAWLFLKEREDDIEPMFVGEASLNEEVTKNMLFEVDGEEAVVCPECGAIEGTSEWGTVGDGHDGYCPNCADKREREGVYNS